MALADQNQVSLRVLLTNSETLPDLMHDRRASVPIRGSGSELNRNDRATVVMACGTGKSFVVLWHRYRNMLVLAEALTPVLLAST